MTTWLFDTGIWLQLATKQQLSSKAARLVRDQRHVVLASAVSIAELISVCVRRGLGDRINVVLQEIRKIAPVQNVTAATFEEAGWIHGRERAHHSHFSLADAILLAQAQAAKARILTTDQKLAKNHEGVKATLP